MLVAALLSLPVGADDALKSGILGKWRYQGRQAGATIESVAEFKADGIYLCKMQVNLFGARSTIRFKGSWRIENEEDVIIEVTETSSPLFLPKGKIMRKEDVEIVEEVMTYRYGGKSEREERVSDVPDVPDAGDAGDAPVGAEPGTK